MIITSRFRWRGFIALLLVFLAIAAQAQSFTPVPLEGTQRPAGSALDSIKGWFGAGAQPTLLEPDVAFQIQVRAADANTIVATLTSRHPGVRCSPDSSRAGAPRARCSSQNA